MSSSDSIAEKLICDSFFYPNSKVLRNKLNIRNQDELDRAEAEFLANNAPNRPKLIRFTLDEIKGIHKHLFEDIYEWAGKLRIYTTGRGEASFARPEYIESYFKSSIFKPLVAENFLIGADKDKFIKRSAYFANEFNAVHPFLDGNGRITRILLSDLALRSGYTFSIRRLEANKGAWYEAMALGFEQADTSKLEYEISCSLTHKEINKNILRNERDKSKNQEKDRDFDLGL
jgi:cell filamentation protein